MGDLRPETQESRLTPSLVMKVTNGSRRFGCRSMGFVVCLHLATGSSRLWRPCCVLLGQERCLPAFRVMQD